MTSGMENASVLPLPVLPRPRTSRPASVSGRVSTWIGNGAVMPCCASTLVRDSGTPSSSKVLGVVMFSVPLGHRLHRVAATALSCSWWVQGWRDCQSAKSIAAKKALDVGAFHDAVGILAPTLFPTLADQPLIACMR